MITTADHTPNLDFYTYFLIISPHPPPSMAIPSVSTVARNEMKKFWET